MLAPYILYIFHMVSNPICNQTEWFKVTDGECHGAHISLSIPS